MITCWYTSDHCHPPQKEVPFSFAPTHISWQQVLYSWQQIKWPIFQRCSKKQALQISSFAGDLFVTRNLTFAHVRIGLPQSWLVCLYLFLKEISYFEFPPDFAPQTDQIMCFNVSIVFSLQVLIRCQRVTISCWDTAWCDYSSCLELTISRIASTYYLKLWLRMVKDTTFTNWLSFIHSFIHSYAVCLTTGP